MRSAARAIPEGTPSDIGVAAATPRDPNSLAPYSGAADPVKTEMEPDTKTIMALRRDEILSKISSGQTAKAVWQTMTDARELSVSYQGFMNYVNAWKALGESEEPHSVCNRAVEPITIDTAKLIHDIENALVDRMNQWAIAFHKNQEDCAAESRILAEKSFNAALLAAQTAAVNIIRAASSEHMAEIRKELHAHGLVPSGMSADRSPQFLGDVGKWRIWRRRILQWVLWIAAAVSIGMLVLLIQNAIRLHLF